jgi:hypothetical protein
MWCNPTDRVAHHSQYRCLPAVDISPMPDDDYQNDKHAVIYLVGDFMGSRHYAVAFFANS